MYLELLKYSAEIKFLIAYVLAQTAWASIDIAVGTDGVEGTYLRSICGAALINAGVCRVHRSTFTTSPSISSSIPSISTFPSLALSELLNMDAITLCNAGINKSTNLFLPFTIT